MRGVVLAVVFSTLVAPCAARANDVLASEKAKDATAVDAPKDAPAADANAPRETGESILLKPQQRPSSLAGASVLRSLHVGFGLLQAYDVYSTTRALRRGAIEANPLMKNAVTSRGAFIGLKVAVTVGPIYQAERLWRGHHRVGAIALMAVANGVMMGVAAHNAAVLKNPVVVR